MAWIVGPRSAAAKITASKTPAAKITAPKTAAIAAAESVPTKEARIDEQAIAEPSTAPSPAAPAAPAREIAAHVDTRSKPETEPKSKTVRVPQIRVSSPHGGTPHVSRIVDRNVDDLRIGRLYLDGALVVLRVGGDHLLRRGRQPAVRLGPGSHSLHRAHHIGLLGQEGVPQVRGPADIVAQQLQRIRKRDQRLNTGIPVLLFGGIHQLRALKIAVLLNPLLRLDDLQRIRARGQYLAEEWVGVECDRRNQVIQLIRR